MRYWTLWDNSFASFVRKVSGNSCTCSVAHAFACMLSVDCVKHVHNWQIWLLKHSKVFIYGVISSVQPGFRRVKCVHRGTHILVSISLMLTFKINHWFTLIFNCSLSELPASLLSLFLFSRFIWWSYLSKLAHCQVFKKACCICNRLSKLFNRHLIYILIKLIYVFPYQLGPPSHPKNPYQLPSSE